MSNLDEIANSEFGLDYDQLGRGEQEWCRDERAFLARCYTLNNSITNKQ